MENRINEMINHVAKQSSQCKHCTGICPCKILHSYLNEVGQERFMEEVKNGTLPAHVKSAYDTKISKLG